MNKTNAAIVRMLLLGTSCLSAFAVGAARAQPAGGSVALGSATITSNGANSTLIDQKTGKLVINWDSFNIAAGGTVQFKQPGASSIALNRILGADPSSIYGNLLANGQVWIVNGNGVMFGQGSRITVGGLIATTADIADGDFAAGNYNFSGGTGASVVNQGTIRTGRGGYAVLSGAGASNSGLISADTGTVVIGGASAFTIDFQGDGLLSYAVTTPGGRATSGPTGASNSGTIKAGHVVMTARAAAGVADAVVNNTGMISASSARVQNGEVILDAGDGDVSVGGTVSATGTGSGTTGGDVTVTGRNITVADGTKIDASGDAGGGTVRIGGDLHGAGPTPDAANTTVGTATIKADATHTGNGGTVVVWSNGTTDFAGVVSAKGSTAGGDGGLVETSGHTLHVAPTASVDTRAPKGATGTWLLDPDSIVVAADCTGCDPDSTLVTPATITGSLATTDVTLEATTGIDVVDPVIYSSTHALSLLSEGDINVLASVQNTLVSGGGAINVIAGWDGTTLAPASFTAAGVYGNNSGSVFVGDAADGVVAVGAASGTTTIAGDAVIVGNDDFYAQIGFHGAGGGAIVVRATDTVGLSAGSADGAYAQIGNGARNGDVTGNVAGNIDIAADGDLNLFAGEGTGAGNWIGNFTAGSGVGAGNVSLVVGQVTYSGTAGPLGAMLLADLGTTAHAGSGGNVVFGVTDPQTDFINKYLGVGAIDYSSPHAFTLLSTGSITLPYSIQNDGTGDLTVLAGWNPSVAPADVLTTPGAYGNLVTEIDDGQGIEVNANVWVVGAPNISLVDTNPGSHGGFVVGASGTGTAIGSKGGTTTVGAGQIYIEGLTGYAQIGYHADGGTGAINVIANGVPGNNGLTGINACFDGAANICLIGGRDGLTAPNGNTPYAQIGDLGLGVAGTASSAINVSATGNIAIAGGGIYDSNEGYDPSIANAYGQIGNGDASRTAVQTVSGAITVQAGGQTNFASSAGAGSPAWLGNRTGAGGSQSGDVTVLAGSLNASTSPEAMFVEDLGTSATSGGNLVIGLSGTGDNGLAAGDYNSPHDFTYLAGGNVYVVGSIKNDGTGAITLVAGWDGHTLGPAVLGQAGAYGNNDATLTIGGDYASGNVSVGSAGGATTVLGGDVDIAAVWGNTQLGYHGAGTGDITVRATGDIDVLGGDPNADGYYAMIGNGKPTAPNFTGSVGGNIQLSAGGTFILETATEECGECGDPVTIFIGNVAGTGGQASGNLTMLAADFDDNYDANGGFGNVLGANILHGDVTVGETDPQNAISLSDGGVYNSSHTLTLLSAGDINIAGGFQNAGSGAITLVAGWNGVYDPNAIGAAGTYGVDNQGTIVIGGYDAAGFAGIGAAQGDLRLYGANLYLDADNGAAQLGYHGAGGGNIVVAMTGNIEGYGGNAAGYDALLGNGGLDGDVGGDVTGNISLSAGGYTTFTDKYVNSALVGRSWLGNVADAGDSESGDVTVLTRGGSFRGDYMTADLGGAPGTGGDVFFGFTDPAVTPITLGGIHYNSSNDFTWAAAGSLTLRGGVTNGGTGAVTLVAGWDGHTVGGAADLKAAGAYGRAGTALTLGDNANQFENISVGSASGLTTVLADDLTIAPKSGYYAQLGYHGAGGGEIDAFVSGNLTLQAGSGATDYAMIGNGSLSGDVTGDVSGKIDVEVPFGTTGFHDGAGGARAWLGNVTSGDGKASGDVTILTDFGTVPTDMLVADLGTSADTGGDVFFGYIDPNDGQVSFGGMAYNSPHDFTIASPTDLLIGTSIQNAGTGEVTMVAGWDEHTIGSSAVLLAANAYGLHDSTLTIAGDDVAAGSAGGLTTALGTDIVLTSGEGYAQLGYHGAGTGAVNVIALGALTLDGGTDTAHFAQIGSGSIFGADTDAGDANVAASSVQASGFASVVADDLSLTAGAVGNSNAPLQIAANTLTLATAGGDAYLTTPTSLAIAGADLAGGNLTIAAAGAVTQTGAILAGLLNVSTASGAITLTNAGNAVAGTVSLSTPGAASFTDSLDLSIGAGTVGGTLTLVGPSISQTGAIVAAGLNATATSGAIVLDHAGNSFAALSLSTTGANDASVTDGSAVALGASVVGGTLTLSSAGAITQSAAITAGTLNASTSGADITLGNDANQIGVATVTTGGGDARVNSDGSMVLAGVDVGAGSAGFGSSHGSLSQTGAIVAGDLEATAYDNVTLTNGQNVFSALNTGSLAGAIAVTDSTGFTLQGASTGTDLSITLSAGGDIRENGSGVIESAGPLTLTTSAGSIDLDGINDIYGQISLNATGDATLLSQTSSIIAASSVGGALTLVSAGGITQTGAIQAGGVSATANGGDVVLADSGNAFSSLTLSTAGAARVADSTAVTVAGANVGGTLTLVDAAGIAQSGAIDAAALNATANGGTIVLTNSGNSFAALTLSSFGDATIADSTGVTLGASSVGGTLTLSAGGAVSQSGSLQSTGLSVATTAGAIVLSNAANAVSGLVSFTTPGAASFADTLGASIGASAVGGDLTLLSKGDLAFVGSIQSNGGAITVVAGWDGTTTNPAQFGAGGVYGNGGGRVAIGGSSGIVAVGSKSGALAVYASSVDILGTNGAAQLGYHGAGGGSIKLVTLHDLNLVGGAGNALLGNGSLGTDVSGNVTGDIDVRVGGNAIFTDAGNAIAWLGNVANAGSETGNLVLVAGNVGGNQASRTADIVGAALGGGDVTLGFTATGDQGTAGNFSYTSGHTLNLLTAGNLVIAGSIQNAGSGAINLVAGWDGHTLAPASFGQSGVFGGGAKGVTIGGSSAKGGVAIGSAGGTISVYGASLALSAVNGYAQLGFNGHGSGAIAVTTTGAVTLTGGGASGAFAQIGNGGQKASGNNSGAISIAAGGNIVLTAGAGGEAYAQIGHGGAESNTGSTGYSNSGAIGLTAANLTLTAGAGTAAYVQIGQGGYKSGLSLAGGQAVNGGNITVTAAHAVTLTGNGIDAYAQIGNGGSQSNLNAAAAAGGTDSGVIAVLAPNGPNGAIALTAGAGPNAYAQIGNGGYAVNSGPTTTAANFTVTGDVTVADLALAGGGANGYSLIGNGDASHSSFGTISGNVVIDANGAITYTSGTGAHSQATIGNFTGKGTTSGTITGANPPSEIGNDPGTLGVVVTTIANTKPTGNSTLTTIDTVVVPAVEQNGGAAALAAHIETNTPPPPGPLASLSGNSGDSSTSNTSDGATVVIADSLDGAKKAGVTQAILAGMLTQMNPTSAGHTVHAVPPADQDFSSWGNEALWQ
ncbi:MAG: filamentous hemagglutinin N-terminal domain-containing protein [Rhizomicrobium sp.]